MYIDGVLKQIARFIESKRDKTDRKKIYRGERERERERGGGGGRREKEQNFCKKKLFKRKIIKFRQKKSLFFI